MTWSPLMTHKMENTVDRASRAGRQVHSIGHHHTAGPNKDAALSAFMPGGREVTPNYFIWEDEIWGIVDEDYAAYTSASRDGDGHSITYEICNSTGGPEWMISETTKNTVARLDAEISTRRSIQRIEGFPGFWQHRNLYEWFGWGYPTACAGPDFNTQDMIARTNRVGTSEGEEDMASQYFIMTDDVAKAKFGIGKDATLSRTGVGQPLLFLTPGQAREALLADRLADDKGYTPASANRVFYRSGNWLLSAVAEDNIAQEVNVKLHPFLAAGGQAVITEKQIEQVGEAVAANLPTKITLSGSLSSK